MASRKKTSKLSNLLGRRKTGKQQKAAKQQKTVNQQKLSQQKKLKLQKQQKAKNQPELSKRNRTKLNIDMKKKLAVLFGIVLLALVGLAIRISFINFTKGNKYMKQVLSQAQQQYGSEIIPSKRGDIYDRNGNLLATSNKVYNVILDCKVVNSNEDYIEPTIRALVNNFDIDEDEIRSRLTAEGTKESQYQILKRQVSMDDKKKFEEYSSTSAKDGVTDSEIRERQNIKGIWFEEDYLRIYPYNDLACDTIGFTFSRDVADSGLEGYYNSTLNGVDGRQYGHIDSEREAEQIIIEPSTGRSIETTLDVGVQQIVEKYVDAFNQTMGAKNVGVIVEDPSTGEILAMDGGDRYDLNGPRDMSKVHTAEEIKAMNDAETVEALNKMWQNYCVSDAYEPGSVVKPIVVGAALEQGAISESDVFLCDGSQTYATTMIKCAAYPGAHGEETLGEIIANSCNDGMMQIAENMGGESFIRSQSLFNFGTRTGIDLPNEGTGIIHTAATMGATELACSAFGQGFTCTMIQEINAMCSVINGGYYYQPHLVTRIKDANGGVVKSYSPILLKQTISANISADVRRYMALSVKQGTSIHSKVEGYSSGGKTGTAEKLPRGNGKYLTSFITFAPVDDPRVVIYVVVDEPNVEEQATSLYAQYIAQGIMSELLPYLNVVPDEPGGDVSSTEIWEGFDGYLTSTENAVLDEDGNLWDVQGNRIDWDGNRIDEDGYILDNYGNYKYDEYGDPIESKALDRPSDLEGNEGVSDTNVPPPLEDDYSDVEWDNDIETEGLTNEEADIW